MPTRYTAGIIDGKIATFPQFAKLCMRAFGATIHMRDDDLDAEYVQREPGDYHALAISKAKGELDKISLLSDGEIVALELAKLTKGRHYNRKKIKEVNAVKKKLYLFLEDAKKFIPPTQDHIGIGEFMIKQIEETIKFDGDTEFYIEELDKIKSKLLTLDASKIREDMVKNENYNLKYHKEELEKEVQRCENSNRWVSDFLSALSNPSN